MIVIAVKDGYIQFDDEEKTIIEPEKGLPYTVEFDGEMKEIKIIPFGGIVIESYNTRLEKYISGGGSVDRLLRLHREGKIPLLPVQRDGSVMQNEPIPPLWFYSGKDIRDYSLSVTGDFDLPFQKVAFIQFQGQLTPMFTVNKINDLYFYDLYMLKKSGITVRECEECGKAFIIDGNTSATVCSEECRKKRDNKKRAERLENRPGAKQAYAFKNRRIGKKTGSTEKNTNGKLNEHQKFVKDYYIPRLCDLIDEKIKTLSDKDLQTFVQSIAIEDKNFYKLDRFINAVSFTGSIDQLKRWNEERFSFLDREDRETWLRSWCNEIGREWTDK